MGIIKNITTMNDKQKRELKRKAEAVLGNPILQASLWIACMIVLYMAFAAI